MNSRFFLLILFIAASISCQKENLTIVDREHIRAGGETTIFKSGPDAFSYPLANLRTELVTKHFMADANFAAHFVTSPAPVQDGLGPQFNQTSCESCHIRNGRSNRPQYAGDVNTGLLLRISLPGVGEVGQPLAVPEFGTQLQTKAIFGQEAEGTLDISWVEKMITFLDGESITLNKPEFQIKNPYIPLPDDLQISPRNAPAVYGLGLIEAIPERDILQNEDPYDADGDGISGKANRVWDLQTQTHALGRFGWKASTPTTIQQTADAFNHDMGITNFLFPRENCSDQANCNQLTDREFDIDEEFLTTTSFYFETLAVPAARNQDAPEVIKGKQIFEEARCSSCHLPKHVTGHHDLEELAYQTIYPYTDLLLHDMGPDLADNRPDFLADGSEWRTPPLWGIGLTQIVNPNATFLHDGRANNLEEAILWHGGEAKSSVEHYLKLSKSDRQSLISFLSSL
ncbi:MAG: thiol oxidoreductase [Saprospiraceae bacterium]|nr:thiol oxidoreductase [Saprospiraceae bacterium]